MRSRRDIVLNLTLLLAVSFSMPSVVQAAPGKWLVLLCKASDAPAEPHPNSYYKKLFSKSERDLLFDYFDKMSNHAVDVSATEVYGWFPMPVTKAQIAPDKRNNGLPVTRVQTAKDCSDAAFRLLPASGIRINPADYAGIIDVINVPVDSGAAGKHVVVNGEPPLSFYEHEMLHVLGLPDSWVAAPDTSTDHVWGQAGAQIYNDCWDIMSFETCVYMYDTASMGKQGPELQAVSRERLGWLPATRITRIGSSSGDTTVKLAPLSEPNKAGALLVKVEVPGRGFYLVEYREPSGFDQGILFPTVLIREQRLDNTTYLVQRQGGNDLWRTGDVFTDSQNRICIAVDNIMTGQASVRITPQCNASQPARTGTATCKIELSGSGYTHKETQTWNITSPGSLEGKLMVYSYSWRTEGGGSNSQMSLSQSRTIQWKTYAEGSGRIGVFLRPSDGKQVALRRSSQIRVAMGHRGWQRQTIGGKPQRPGAFGAEAFELSWPQMEASRQAQRIAGVMPQQRAPAASLGPVVPAGASATVSCTWDWPPAKN